jgi:hypothetical protein
LGLGRSRTLLTQSPATGTVAPTMQPWMSSSGCIGAVARTLHDPYAAYPHGPASCGAHPAKALACARSPRNKSRAPANTRMNEKDRVRGRRLATSVRQSANKPSRRASIVMLFPNTAPPPAVCASSRSGYRRCRRESCDPDVDLGVQGGAVDVRATICIRFWRAGSTLAFSLLRACCTWGSSLRPFRPREMLRRDRSSQSAMSAS